MINVSPMLQITSTLYNHDFEYLVIITPQWTIDDQPETTIFATIYIGHVVLVVLGHIV
jgi:hypothetical protein